MLKDRKARYRRGTRADKGSGGGVVGGIEITS